MKKYFYFFAIFLFGINWTVNTEAQQAKKDDFSKWILVEKDEVQFRIPQNWRYQQDPEKGVLLKIEPNNDPEKAFMLVVQRAPTPAIQLTLEEEKNLFQQFAVMGRRMIERYGVNAIIKHINKTTINSRNAFIIRYEISSPAGDMGFCDYTFIMMDRFWYGFMSMSIRATREDDSIIFKKILATVNIDESKIPQNVGPESYAEIIENVKATLNSAFQGMPPGWDWKLISAEMRKMDNETNMEIELSLLRDDTASLTSAYALVFNSLRNGVEPNPNAIQCNMNNLKVYMNQYSMILGMSASGFATNPGLKVNSICTKVYDKNNNTSYPCCSDINAFIKAIQTNNFQLIPKAIDCR
jgi:hypothetical protein